MHPELLLLAYAAVTNLQAAGKTVATAESCTGGLIAAALTEVAGASQAFRYGWVTYSNEAKIQQLNVPAELIEQHTVVSEPVVAAMAENALRLSHADFAIAVSGNAGPTAAPGEPLVGTVCIALACKAADKETFTETIIRPGLDRTQFRQMVTARVLRMIADAATEASH